MPLTSRITPIIVLIAALATALITVAACAAEPTPAPISPPVETPAAQSPAAELAMPSPTSTSSSAVMTPTAVSTPKPTPIPYDSGSAMYKVFPGFGMTSARTYDALEEVRLNGDKSMVPVLIESMRYQSTLNAREASAEVLRELTGEQYGGEDWKQWMEWLGRNSADYPPPDGYLAWKIDILYQIYPQFARFLRPALDGQISVDPTEIVWGGVITDGIPDIYAPKLLTAEAADYLRDDDRVFGVSINGDTRAYPLRIINGHEMVNDTVGGEPISLAW